MSNLGKPGPFPETAEPEFGEGWGVGGGGPGSGRPHVTPGARGWVDPAPLPAAAAAGGRMRSPC